ncbi:MFS transporter [Microbulbifer epialgicus]|uniref:MFS transporter n=1 Tax=Microbulbifer epialgicus TaxID=393907 RepID=A0ABV4P182_9GAMM
MFIVKRLFESSAKRKSSESFSRGILIALCLATLLNALAISSVNIILPKMVAEFETTYERAQWIIIAFMIFLTATLAVAGRGSDTQGRKKIFMLGIMMFTLSTFLCGISSDIWILVFFRSLQGISAAMFTAVSMAIASDTSPKARVGMVVGLLGSISALGTGTGPLLGGLLLEILPWQAVFLIKVPFGVIIYWLAQKYLPEDGIFIKNVQGKNTICSRPYGVWMTITRVQRCIHTVLSEKCIPYLRSIINKAEQGHSPTNTLAALYIFMAVLFYTLSIKPVSGDYGISNVVTGALSGLSLWLFCLIRQKLLHDNSIQKPIAYALYTNFATNFLVATSVVSSLVVGPFYLTLALSLDFSQAGMVMSVGSFVVAICSSIGGRLADRFRSRSTVIAGLVSLSLGALGMTNLEVAHGIPGYLICSVAMAIGYGIYLSSNNAFTMNSVDDNVKGNISGLLNLSRNLGLLTGASLMSVVFEETSQLSYIDNANTELMVAGLNRVYSIAFLLLVIALVAQATSILVSHRNRRADSS